MARSFSIPSVLRMLPNRMLERFFKEQGYIVFGWNWKGLKERDVEKLQNAINVQPRETRLRIESDLRDLFDLACDSGVASIAEAAFALGKPNFAAEMPTEGLYYKSIWTRLEHPDIFEAALRQQRFEILSWWRKRNDLPKCRIDVNDIMLARLSIEISDFLVRSQGRGAPCTVEYSEGGEGTQYFYAHPNDFARQATTHDEDQRLTPITLNTTFSVVFAYRPEEGSLELHASLPAQLKGTLERIFARVVFDATLGPWEPDAAYDLEMLKDPRFTFPTDAADRIKVQVRSLRFSGPNTGRRNTIEITEDDDSIHAAIEEWINKRRVSLDEVYVTKASLRFEFLELYGRKAGGVTVDIAYPNACSLNSQRPERVELIRKYLKRWSIDVAPHVVLDFGPLEPHPTDYPSGRMSQAS